MSKNKACISLSVNKPSHNFSAQQMRLSRIPLQWYLVFLAAVVTGGVIVLTLPFDSALARKHLTPTTTGAYANSVIVMDNVSQIAIHDPDGERFSAAQLFVDLAPAGDYIGTVKISSSRAPSTQLSGYHAPVEMNKQNKADLKHTLTPQVFGPVEGTGDPNVPAYISPALQTAGNLLLSHAPSTNRRYIIMVTDAVALSGDQDTCPDAAQFHKWFCTVRSLKQQGITVILIGFARPGSEGELADTRRFIESQGGAVLTVEDGADVARELATDYADLLTSIHSAMFFAQVPKVPDTLTIDARTDLTNLTFVALGQSGVTLSSLSSPAGVETAGKQAKDGTYYSSSPPDSGYWLETISTGTLSGSWKLVAGSKVPESMLVIAISEAHFDLRNPTPLDPNSDSSVRLVSSEGPLVLRASVTDQGGNALPTVPFEASPLSNPVIFTGDSLPDHDASTVDAVLPPLPASSKSSTIQIALGAPLQGQIFLVKNFSIQSRSDLGAPQLNLPTPRLLKPKASIAMGAQGATGPGLTNSSLSIYVHDPTPAIAWQSLANGTTSASGVFTPPAGCGVSYKFIALNEVSGKLPGEQDYDYITFAPGTYSAQIEQTIVGKAVLTSGPYLDWWPDQANWTLNLSSTACTPQTTTLNVSLSGNGHAPSITLASSPDYSLKNAGAGISIASNTSSSIRIPASIGGCSIPSFSQDQTFSLSLTPVSQPAVGSIVQEGTWQTEIKCPSVVTDVKRYPLGALALLCVSSVLMVRGWLRFLLMFSKRYLSGGVEFECESPILLDNVEEDWQEQSDADYTGRVPVNIPYTRRQPIWYLNRSNGSEGTLYSFSVEESRLSVLKFCILREEGGERVTVMATQYARGMKTPVLMLSGEALNAEGYTCDGEPIIIENDIIYPDLKILPIE